MFTSNIVSDEHSDRGLMALFDHERTAFGFSGDAASDGHRLPLYESESCCRIKSYGDSGLMADAPRFSGRG